MNRLRILKEFENLARRESLDTDEIRLFLLLLANCRAPKHGEIEYSTVKSALGKQFSFAKLQRVCRRLSMHGLIEVILFPLDGLNGKDIVIAYRIFLLTGH